MTTCVNGVDVDTLQSVESTIRDDQSKGRVTFRVNDEWTGPAQHRTVTGDISGPMVNHVRTDPHVIEGDEPGPLLGSDRGMSPVEILLTAMTHCVGTTLSYHAALRGVAVRSLTIDAQATIDLQGFLGTNDRVPARASEIELQFRIDADANQSEIEELVHVAVLRSPVTDTVKHGTLVTPVIVS